MKKLLAMLMVLSAFAFATNVNNANFRASDSTWHFDTDMQFTSDFTLRLVSGEVSSGDPNNLQTGDEVCTGAELQVMPTVSAKWATPDFAAVAIYPTCGGGYCPAMINYGSVNSNRNIAWLSSSTWNTQKTFGDSNDFSQDSARYTTLGGSFSFYDQPITYNNVTGEFHNNKEGGAGVFCKGTFEVVDGSTVVDSSAMPTVENENFEVNTEGSHSISTRLSGVSCFAAVVKHPLNIADNPSWFWLDYYTHNAPSIPSTVATDTITITVGSSGGDCSFYDVLGSVEATSDLSIEGVTLLKATVHNSGDPVRITGVSSSNADFAVAPFNTGLCGWLGIPPSLCPPSNGFNTDIASGANRDLYVLIVADAGASGGTTLTFSGQTVSASCGGAAICSDTLSIGSNVATACEITPPALEVDTLVVAEYTVACENLAGDTIPCTGINWYWDDGLVGGFIERTNSYAWAYSTSPPGSSGTLNYESGIAHCLSDIDVREDGLGTDYECEFLPPSATMNISTSMWFDLNCFVNGTQDDPDDAEYDLVNGLGGSTSNSSTDGTTYNAPAYEDSGDLQAFASWASMPDPMVGIVVLAPINVINGSSNDTNGTNDTNNTDNPDNPGSSVWCTIGTSTLGVFPGDSGWVGILCGPPSNLTACTDVVWTTEGGVVLSGQDVTGTGYTITGDPHTSGKIQAVVDGVPGHVCWLGFYIGEPECWEYT